MTEPQPIPVRKFGDHYAGTLVIGVLQVSEKVQLRFRREPLGWIPDLVVDYNEGTVSRAPECFEPTTEVTMALDAALNDTVTMLAMDWHKGGGRSH